MSEKFILNTVFKHETKPIDEQAMRDYLAFIKEELDPESEFWLENIWYKLMTTRMDQSHFMPPRKGIKK